MELCRANHIHQILSQAQLQRTVNNKQVSQFYDSPNNFFNFDPCAFPLSTAISVQPKAIFSWFIQKVRNIRHSRVTLQAQKTTAFLWTIHEAGPSILKRT
jgi:hypothetical protein